MLLALLTRPFAERILLPFAAMLIAIGYIGSEVLVRAGVDTRIRYDTFGDLIFYVFLPLLVFEAAFKIDTGLMRENLLVILTLAIPISLISLGITSSLLYYGIGQPTGFPWIAALITCALLAATDASPVTRLFGRFGIPRRLKVLLEGEDLFSDRIAIVAFSIFVHLALYPSEDVSATDIVVR